MTVRIAVISDIHLRPEFEEDIVECLADTVDEINRSDPDLTVVLGDIIEHSSSAETDSENIGKIKQVLKDLDSEVKYMAGNHDSMNLSNQEISEIIGQNLYGHRNVKGEDLIFLNTSSPEIPGARGEVSEKQLEFLDRKLDEVEEACIFVHHPIHYQDVTDNYWWKDYPEGALCGNKKEVNEIISKHGNVKAVINGHLHEDSLIEYNGIPHITVNAFGKERPDNPVKGSHSLIRISDNLELEEKEGTDQKLRFNIEL